MMNDSGLVVGIDILGEIIEESKKCINKNNKNLLNSGKIILVSGDGRRGFKKYAPYHVIHAGAAVEKISKELYDQLACGGRMFIPVGKNCEDHQFIEIIDKDKDGNITKNKNIIKVNYSYLHTYEETIGTKERSKSKNIIKRAYSLIKRKNYII